MPKLLNIGSLCIDHVYSVDHVTQTGETIASRGYATYPGGKGLNQSLAAAKAGVDVHHFGCVGEDGAWLKDVLTEGGVNSEGVSIVEGATGHAIIQVNTEGQNAIVIVGGTNRSITGTLRRAAFDLLEPGDWILLQNEINDIELILQEAADRNVQVAFNVAPVDGREQQYSYDKVTVLIVNEVEAAALSGESDPPNALERLSTKYPSTHIVLTLGGDGGYYKIGTEQAIRYEPFQVDIVDETAAGDSFIGYLMAGLIDAKPIATALSEANAAGALAVTQAGAASSVPSRSQVEKFLASNTS